MRSSGQSTLLAIFTIGGVALGILVLMIGEGAIGSVATASGLFGFATISMIGWIVLAGVESQFRQLHSRLGLGAQQVNPAAHD
ncbi:hypothetical protein [Paramicrobacterium chengjingii]|uniref:Uncharacterized protein n=1 Tax=Paramicrobacterium chengjingii TaxID=2769067 RepID=A0ABX6YLK3_9MICO|nr:hypothetical protein [Microbacterium chengjingii]QPZ39713.1 hypothetical protein HCR76_06620 [Microbacterium chengjingii]